MGPLLLAVASMAGLALGACLGPDDAPADVLLICLFTQTLIGVGGLAHGWHTETANVAHGLRLLRVHHLAGTAPLLIAALLVGLDTTLGAGLAVIAAVPIAAGVPAYAFALGIAGERLTMACIFAYLLGIVLTPFLLWITIGDEAGLDSLVVTLLIGLILPTILGVAGARVIQRAPRSLRQGIVLGCVATITFLLGGTLGFDSIDASRPGGWGIVALVGLFRAPICGALGYLPSRRAEVVRPVEAMMAGGYKNLALAATLAHSLLSPAAAAPATLGLLSEALLVLIIAARSRRRVEPDAGACSSGGP